MSIYAVCCQAIFSLRRLFIFILFISFHSAIFNFCNIERLTDNNFIPFNLYKWPINMGSSRYMYTLVYLSTVSISDDEHGNDL